MACIQIPLSFLVVIVLHKGRHALWSAIATTNAISAIVYGVSYARSRTFWPRRPGDEDDDDLVPPSSGTSSQGGESG